MDVDWDAYDDDEYDESGGENDRVAARDYDDHDDYAERGERRESDGESEDMEEEEVDEYVKEESDDDTAEIDEKAEKLSSDMREAYNVVCHLMSAENHLHNWPFMTAVDSKNGALWDYDTIVKDPVWLKQVRDDILDGRLETLTEVFRRLRLMFRNCYRYNGPQHSVTRRALRLESVMEQQIEQMEPRLAEQCSLAVTEGEEAVVDQKIVNRRRNNRGKTQGFFSHVLHWVRHERSDREKECRRQQLESKRQKRQEKEQRVVEWESRLMSTNDGHRLRTMWEIPQMAQFIHLSLRALHIFEVPLYEMERMFLVPQSSETLAILMSSLVSPPLTRIKLVDLPPMPYSVWTEKLAGRVQNWYRVYAREKSRPEKLFDSLGIDPSFWHVLGTRNPFESRLFHELSFYQRVCMVKALCDFLFHIHKTVQECVTETAEEEPRETLLGVDRNGFEYIHLPLLYVKDVRVYRRRPWVLEPDDGNHSVDADIEEISSRASKRRQCAWTRAQLGVRRRTVARALSWAPSEGGTGGAWRFLCLGAEFTALDGVEDGEQVAASEYLTDGVGGQCGGSDMEDSDGADSCTSGGVQKRRSSTVGSRRGRGSRGGARRRSSKKSGAGLRVGPGVWCDVSSGEEEEDVVSSVKGTSRGGKRKSVGRGGVRGSRGRGRGRGTASWRESGDAEALGSIDDGERDRSPPRKRGRGIRSCATRKSFSVPTTTDPNICPHCGMSLRSERARKAHRCFRENDTSWLRPSPLPKEGEKTASVCDPVATPGDTSKNSTPGRRRGRPARKRGSARSQRSWHNGVDTQTSPSHTAGAADEPEENGVLDDSTASLEETLGRMDSVRWSDRHSLANGTVEGAAATDGLSDAGKEDQLESGEESVLKPQISSEECNNSSSPLTDVRQQACSNTPLKEELVDDSCDLSELKGSSTPLKGEPVDPPCEESPRIFAEPANVKPVTRAKEAVDLKPPIGVNEADDVKTSIQAAGSNGCKASINVGESSDSKPSIEPERSNDDKTSMNVDESSDAKPSVEPEGSNDDKISMNVDESSDAKPSVEPEGSYDIKVSMKVDESNDVRPSLEAGGSNDDKASMEVDESNDVRPSVEAGGVNDLGPPIDAEGSKCNEASMEIDESNDAIPSIETQGLNDREPPIKVETADGDSPDCDDPVTSPAPEAVANTTISKTDIHTPASHTEAKSPSFKAESKSAPEAEAKLSASVADAITPTSKADINTRASGAEAKSLASEADAGSPSSKAEAKSAPEAVVNAPTSKADIHTRASETEAKSASEAEAKPSASETDAANHTSKADINTATSETEVKSSASEADANSTASEADDKDSVSSVGMKVSAADSDSNSALAVRSSTGNNDGDTLPLPLVVQEPGHVSPADEDHFLLVADTFDSLRALIDKFVPNTESLACEVHLHKALTALLQELEPLQAKINQSVSSMRKRLCQEWLSYLDRPPGYRDPNENAWKEPEVETEPASKKRAKTPTPPPSPEPELNESDGEWGDGRRRTRSRRAKRKPVNYCVDGGDERRRAPGSRGQQADGGSLQVSSRGRVRRVRKMADFDYNENSGQYEFSDEEEDSMTASEGQRAEPRGTWRRRGAQDDDEAYIEPLPAWNSDLASSLSNSVDARVSQIRSQLQGRLQTTGVKARSPATNTLLRPNSQRRILVGGSGAAPVVSRVSGGTLFGGTTGLRPALAADKYVLRMGENGAMYMEKLGTAATKTNQSPIRLAATTNSVTGNRMAVMLPCQDPSGSNNKVLVPVAGPQAQTIGQTGTLLGCLATGSGAVTAIPLGSMPVSAVGAQLLRLPLMSGSPRPILTSSQPLVSPAPTAITRVALRVVNSQAPAASPVVTPPCVSTTPKLQGPPPPMQRAPRLVSSSVRFVNSPVVSASSSTSTSTTTAGVVPRAQNPATPRASGPSQQQGKVVVIKSGGEQKLGVLLGNGQVVQLSEAQANAVRKQAEKRNKTLPELGPVSSMPSSPSVHTAAVVSTTTVAPAVSAVSGQVSGSTPTTISSSTSGEKSSGPDSTT